jgi:hypothetical protein
MEGTLADLLCLVFKLDKKFVSHEILKQDGVVDENESTYPSSLRISKKYHCLMTDC